MLLHAGHTKWVWDCVFSVDAAYLVTASSDCTARLWDLSTGDAIRVYSGHHKVFCGSTCRSLRPVSCSNGVKALWQGGSRAELVQQHRFVLALTHGNCCDNFRAQAVVACALNDSAIEGPASGTGEGG